jgi:5-methylcytosine-specific restriction endonuclease McrA
MLKFFDDPAITTLAELQAAKELASQRASLQAADLAPGQDWCFWCEHVFYPPSLAEGHYRCHGPGCDKTYRRFRAREASLAGRCLDCNMGGGRHVPECKGQALLSAGVPQGPCLWCGGSPGDHIRGCLVVYFVRQDGLCSLCGRGLDPQIPYPQADFVTREHVFPRSKAETTLTADNLELAHKRCNEWKSDNPAPFGQPFWGVLAGVPKVEGYHQKPTGRHA